MNEKTYLVVQIPEEDGGFVITRMTGDKIRELAKQYGQETFAIIDGNVLHSCFVKTDLSKL